MKEQFVPYKITLLLKEAGFGEQCLAYYDNAEYTLRSIDTDFVNFRSIGECIAAPLWQQAIEWFEDKHNIILSRNVNYSSLNGVLVHVGHNYRLSRVGMVGDPIFTKECPSRIEAASEAIEHALILIENFSK